MNVVFRNQQTGAVMEYVKQDNRGNYILMDQAVAGKVRMSYKQLVQVADRESLEEMGVAIRDNDDLRSDFNEMFHSGDDSEGAVFDNRYSMVM